VLSFNQATGYGANPPQPGTPGGGNGGAVAVDGNEFSVRIAGSVIEENRANEGGGAIFFVSNNRTGTLVIESSILRRNASGTFETAGMPGVFFLGAGTPELSASPPPEPAPPDAVPPEALPPEARAPGGRSRRPNAPRPVQASPTFTG
jgi:hypothetical protein